MNELRITSSAFEAGGWIPKEYTGHGEDKSPQLTIDGLDKRTLSIVITLDDLGHPIKPGYNHWVAWNIPPLHSIPEALPKGAIIDKPFSFRQGLAYGKHCYRGPKPPLNWNHDYAFTVYALDSMIDVDVDSNKEAVLRAMEGHVLQTGVLIGKYRRRHD